MASAGGNDGGDRDPTEFEIRRAELVGQIGYVSRFALHSAAVMPVSITLPSFLDVLADCR